MCWNSECGSARSTRGRPVCLRWKDFQIEGFSLESFGWSEWSIPPQIKKRKKKVWLLDWRISLKICFEGLSPQYFYGRILDMKSNDNTLVEASENCNWYFYISTFTVTIYHRLWFNVRDATRFMCFSSQTLFAWLLTICGWNRFLREAHDHG